MKKFLVIVPLLLLSNILFGQIKIGNNTEITNSSVLLEFDNENGNNIRGIVVPIKYEDSQRAVDTTKNGTFIVDYSDNIFKVFSNDTWVDLTSKDGNVLREPFRRSAETGNVGKGIVITDDPVIANDDNYVPNGGLELISETKALVLPQIKDPHLNVNRPMMGFMCYDTTTKSIAFYDGTFWHYWK